MGPSQDLLERFAALERDADVHAFAKKWGVLGLCEHGLPRFHNFARGGGWCALVKMPTETDSRIVHQKGRVRAIGTDVYKEPVVGWLSLARAARSILKIALENRSNRLAEPPLWSEARVGSGGGAHLSTLQSQRDELVAIVDRWLLWGDVRPRAAMMRTGVAIGLGCGPAWRPEGGLFTALACQLAARVEAGGKAICHGCGRPFTPSPKATTGIRSYCPSAACKRASRADAARDSRARRRAVSMEKGEAVECSK